MTEHAAEYTPTPWSVETAFQEPGIWIAAPDTSIVARVYEQGGLGVPNAARIVRCVNAHDALVEACLAAFDFVDSGGEDGSPLKIIKQLTAALAAADKE